MGRLQTGSRSYTSTYDPGGGRRIVTDTTTTVNTFIQFNNQTVTTSTNQSRQGIQFGVTERFDSKNLGDKIVSREIITTMRSRNIEIIAKRLKPSSKVYAFLIMSI